MVIRQAPTVLAAPVVQLLTSVALAVSTIAPAAAAQNEAPAVRVLIVLVPTDDIPAPAAIMRDEVHRIWQPAGVEFRWVERLTDEERNADRVITVRIADDAADRAEVPARALGAVPIVAGRMRQMIYVSPSAAREFVSKSGASIGGARFIHLYARMVGRVIAHELGHLLLNVFDHRSSGLMRASFGASDVWSADAARFSLPAMEVARWRDRVTPTDVEVLAAAAPVARAGWQRRR